MIIDGRAIANGILESVQGALPPGVRPVVRAISVGTSVATRSYLRSKSKAAQLAGMVLEVVELPEESTTQEVISAIEIPGVHAVLVQLPLPAHIDQDLVLKSIPVKQDADALSPETRTGGTIVPPVAKAVEAILSNASVSIEGKRTIVLGNGYLVGRPVSQHLRNLGADVTTYDKDSFDESALASAEIIVSGTGVSHLIKPHMIQEGVVLIDAGTSEQGGVVVGDIDPACSALASVYTPVPGGVGPVAVACLFQNVLQIL